MAKERAWEKAGLEGKDKIMVELLEEILLELEDINETLKGSRPSPS